MTQPSNELERLQAEVDALRQAKASLEQQVGAVTKMMVAMVAEVSAKSRQLEERNAEQTRLGAFISNVMETMDSLLLVVEMYLMIKFARLGPSSLHTGRYHFEQQQPAAA